MKLNCQFTGLIDKSLSLTLVLIVYWFLMCEIKIFTVKYKERRIWDDWLELAAAVEIEPKIGRYFIIEINTRSNKQNWSGTVTYTVHYTYTFSKYRIKPNHFTFPTKILDFIEIVFITRKETTSINQAKLVIFSSRAPFGHFEIRHCCTAPD